MLTPEKIRKGVLLCREQCLGILVKAILNRPANEILLVPVKESWTEYLDWRTNVKQ